MVDKLVNTEANTKRIQFVESCFGNSGQPLLIPGRVLVGEGVLTKMCRKKPKARQFFLFNDILVYGNIIINKKKYNKQHIIPLEEVKIKSLPDEGVLKNGWLISSRSKSFAVYAATSTEKSEWIAHINKCISDLLAKTGKVASSEYAAPWIPDSEASICMHCKKSQFTLINRRHHCRNCGLVVCSMCANKKFMLPHQSSRPLRVCLTCYDKLSKSPQAAMNITGDDGKKMGSNMAGSKQGTQSNDDSDSSSSDNDDDVTASNSNTNAYNFNNATTVHKTDGHSVDDQTLRAEVPKSDFISHPASHPNESSSSNEGPTIRRPPPPIPPPPHADTKVNGIEESVEHSTAAVIKDPANKNEESIGDSKLIDLENTEQKKSDARALSDDIQNIVLN